MVPQGGDSKASPLWNRACPETDRVGRRCETWACPVCGGLLALAFELEFVRVLEGSSKPWVFLTLTLNGRAREVLSLKECYGVLAEARGKFLKRARRKGVEEYVWVRELQRDGTPHLHLVVDRYLPVEWVAGAWKACAGEWGDYEAGANVEKVDDARGLAGYLSEELSEERPGMPEGMHRWGRSEGLMDPRGLVREMG